jgi:hypothetical protein
VAEHPELEHCPNCRVTWTPPEPCDVCVAEWLTRPDPERMTPAERVAEMNTLDAVLSVPFEMFHKRIERLVGRPVWTHEMASPVWPQLVTEAGDRVHPSLFEVIDKIQQIKPGAPVIAVVVE